MQYNSRLSRIQEKRNLRKAALLIGLVVLILALLAVYGVPLLVKLVGFIAPQGSQKPEKTDMIPPIPPRIILPYSATNSGVIDISGLAEPESTVFLSVNGDSLQTATNNNGTFTITNVNLKEGSNSLTAVAVDNSGNRSQPSNSQNLQLLTKAVIITVDSPTDLAQINSKSVNVSGNVSALVDRLTVNGKIVNVNSDNKFTYNLALQSGNNPIVIQATDLAGNISRKELSVTSTQ